MSRTGDGRFRLLSAASLRWVIAHRAWTPYHLLRYARFIRFRLSHRSVECEGLVFLGRRIEVQVDPGYGRIVLGAFSHVGDQSRLRAHQGTLRIGEKVVLGRDTTINAHLDIEIGAATIVADGVYIGDFDHRTADPDRPIKDQGMVTSPVVIGPGCWIGVKSSVLRATWLGPGCVLAAHAVARGTYPARTVVAGVPGRVVKRLGPERTDGLITGA